MKLNWQISAGEFFELLRPAALVSAAVLSTWVLASARRWRFRSYFAGAWTLGTFFLPLVVLPVYLIARGARKRQAQSSAAANESGPQGTVRLDGSAVRLRFVFPLVYCLVLLALIGLYFYRDSNNVDAHLARAVQSKLMNQREKTVLEYRAALALEDNPHTHKLLGIELAETHQLPEALREFRLAESGGEPDESLPFRIGQALDEVGNPVEAMVAYRRFLESPACRRVLPDNRCAEARTKMHLPQADKTPLGRAR